MDLPAEATAGPPAGPGRRLRPDRRLRPFRWLSVAACAAVLAVAATVTTVIWRASPAGRAARATRAAAASGASGASGSQPGAGAGAAAASRPRTRDGLAGSPAIGAVFSTTAAGRLQTHFCTASVIDSPQRDLLVTAAHCVNGFPHTSPVGLVFVPGYYRGRKPYGIWMVTRIYVDAAWTATADPDHDVAFLTVRKPGSTAAIQDITGGERLGAGLEPSGTVRVIGYPRASSQPISCQNRVSEFSATQMRFDCDNFTTGTSGSPFLIDVDAATGEGTVIGVIGGYQEGGDTPDVSYAATFGSAVQALYDVATGRR